MKIGFVGLGKLGLPCALAAEAKGHEVFGVDPVYCAPASLSNVVEAREFDGEEGVAELLAKSKIKTRPHAQLIADNCDIIFVAVQTPHDPAYEGVTPAPEHRKDFDYSHLRVAIEDITSEITCQKPEKPPILVIISTVLPGTIRRRIRNLIPEGVKLIYNPYFIAMGTVIKDFYNPEFVLLGGDRDPVVDQFYKSVCTAPLYWTTIENAELIKVAYNVMIGLKIGFANTIMEVCHKTQGTDVDGVMSALKMAWKRLISTAYLNGGMGDGGGCHPRDQIALSWLAQELDLSHDLFTDIIKMREDQTAWLADLAIAEHRRTGLPIVLLGAEFKANSDLTTGSPALLLKHFIEQRGYVVSRVVARTETAELPDELPNERILAVVTANHDCWKTGVFAEGSVIIDPWREQPERAGVKLIKVGVGPNVG